MGNVSQDKWSKDQLFPTENIICYAVGKGYSIITQNKTPGRNQSFNGLGLIDDPHFYFPVSMPPSILVFIFLFTWWKQMVATLLNILSIQSRKKGRIMAEGISERISHIVLLKKKNLEFFQQSSANISLVKLGHVFIPSFKRLEREFPER